MIINAWLMHLKMIDVVLYLRKTNVLTMANS